MRRRFLVLVCVAMSSCSTCPDAAKFDASERLQQLWNQSLANSDRIVNWPEKANLQREIFDNTHRVVHVVKTKDVTEELERLLAIKDTERFILYGAPSDLKKHKCLVEIRGGEQLGFAAEFDLNGNLILLRIIPEG